MYHYILSAQLYILSFLFSFYLSSLLITNKYANVDTSDTDKLEQEMITHCNNYMFQFKYLDELNEVDICFNNVVKKENTTTLEIPFLNNKIIMFYDTERGAFCYYTKGDVIYKYLNVACRKYVIEHNCRHLYLELDRLHSDTVTKDTDLTKDTNKDTTIKDTESNKMKSSNLFVNSLFVKKNEKTLLVKNVNKFISVGSIEEYEKSLLANNLNVKNISFSDYLLLNSKVQVSTGLLASS